MLRKRMMLVLGVFVLGLFLGGVPVALADEDGGSKEQEEADRFMDIDFGDDDEKDGDGDAVQQPSKEVDLDQALADGQKRRLDKIKRDAGKAEAMVEKADKAYGGQDKRLKKVHSIRLYDQAGKLYRGPIRDAERLAKLVQDEDASLTILRQYRDVYRNAAAKAFCDAARVVIELSQTPNDLRQIGGFLKQAHQVDPKHAGIKEVRDQARERYAAMKQEAEARLNEVRGGGSGDEEEPEHYEDGRDRDHGTGRTERDKHY